jgi:HD-like signal output (HDOD) protein
MTDASQLVAVLSRFPNADRLPSPSAVALRLADLAAREDVSLPEFVRTLRSDAALAGRVLKFANSASVAARRRVTSVDEAVLRVGLAGVRRLSLAFSIMDCNRAGPCAAFDYAAHWSRSLARAIAAEQIAKRSGLATPEDCFTLGLLADIGSLALATLEPTRYGAVLRANPWSAEQLRDAERTAFDVTHAELSALLLLTWRVPAPLVQAATGVGHASPVTPAAPDALAGLFGAASAVSAWCLDLGLAPLDPQAHVLAGLTEAEMDEALTITAQQWADWKADFQLAA